MRTVLAALFTVLVFLPFLFFGVPGRAFAQPVEPQPTATRPPPPPPDLPPPPPPPWQPGGPVPVPTDTQAPPDNGDHPPLPPQRPRQEVDNGALQAQSARISALEKDLAELREAERRARLPYEDREHLSWLRFFRVYGFLQPELQWQFYDRAASPNVGPNGTIPANIGANDVVAKANGTTTNPDYFQLRRARLITEFAPSEGARFVMEINPTALGGPQGGTGTIAREVEAIGIAKWSRTARTEFGMGMFKMPFGREVPEYDADRPFIERSWAAQNLFPGEYDTGARTATKYGRLGFDLAVVNGQMLGEKTFTLLPDLNKGKDLVGRVSLDFFKLLVLGASGYYGQGELVDPVGLRFKQYPRWAYGFDVTMRQAFAPGIGETRVLWELYRGQNMDRGTNYAFALPAIPAVITQDVQNLDELGMMLRVEQDLTRHFTLGVRYDFYTPDSAQGTNQRDTYGVVGVVHFTKALSLSAEYDYAIDNIHPAGTPPPSKHINTLVSVLQVRF